jgi:hypothetical protein
VFFPNLDGDFVDVSGRGENRCGGSGRGRRTAAGLLTLEWWCSGCTARARCCLCSLVVTFLKEGVWSWFYLQDCFFVSKNQTTNKTKTNKNNEQPRCPCRVASASDMFVLLLLFLFPAETSSVLVSLGSAGRYGYWSSTPRQECEVRYPGKGTTHISTSSTSINNLATWSNRGKLFSLHTISHSRNPNH